MTHDFRLALRMLFKSPAFCAVAILAFALGIGANTAIFSVVNSVLLCPLGYADPDRLVMLEHLGPSPVAPATFLDWQEQAKGFEQMAATQAWGGSLRGGERPEPLVGLRVSANLFSLLGVPPLRGRTFTPGEDQEGREPVVVIAYSLWQRQFGGAADTVGRKIDIDGAKYTVVGVMPQGFRFAPVWITRAEVWAPFILGDRRTDRTGQSVRVFARLRPGVTLAQAQTEASSIMSGLARQYPDSSAKLGVMVTTLLERVSGGVRPLLLVFLGGVAFVLLIACANVANLMLVRAIGRQRDLAVRLALGASSWRLTRQAMTEAALLAALGGILGAGLAFAGVAVLQATLPPDTLPRQQELRVDRVALAFTAALSILTGLLSGLLTAGQFRRSNLNDPLREGGRSGMAGRGSQATRYSLVAAEVALAFVVVAGLGLLLRSFDHIVSLDPGFDPRQLISLELSVSGTAQAEPQRRQLFYREVLERVSQLPGVTAAGAVNHAPITGDVWGTRFRVEGQPEPLPGEWPGAAYRVSWPGYFGVMRIPLLRGRDFTPADTLQSQLVVVVNEALAKKYWPKDDALGKRIRSSDDTWTIVGVVKNVKQMDWQEAPREEIYYPFLQSSSYLTQRARHYEFLNLVVRVDGDAASHIAALRNAIALLDSTVLVSKPITMDHAVQINLWRPRLSLLLAALFGAIALALAITGVFGVISHSLSQRKQEFGVRLALGATQRDVLLQALRTATVPVWIGLALGVPLALALTRSLSSLLYQVKATDPLAFAGAAALLLGAGVFAAFWPARSAARIDPSTALRQ